jgi:hypothetical protein
VWQKDVDTSRQNMRKQGNEGITANNVSTLGDPAMFVWLISHQLTILFSQNEPAIINQLSHLISKEEPSASHMCARISSHTYDRQK